MDPLRLSLRALLEEFAAAPHLPEAIPEILFPGARVTGDPGAGAFRIEAEARGEAVHSFDLPLFTPELVALVIERGPPPASKPDVRMRVVGSLDLELSARALDLTFELTPDGAWSAPASGFCISIFIAGPGRIELTVAPRHVVLIPGETRGLQLDMLADIALHGLPSAIQGALGSNASAEVTLSESGIKVIARSVFAPIGVRLPAIEIPGGGAPIELGDLILSANNLTLSVDREVAFSVDLGLGLPPELNRIFDAPVGEVFETYNPEQPEPNLVARVTAQAKDIDIRLLASPLKAIKLTRRPDGSLASDVKLGPYGEISFTMPVFRLDWATKNLVAEGRFSHRDLRLPLAPVIELLKAGGHHEMAERLPSSIPIAPGNLGGAGLAQLLTAALGPRVAEAFGVDELSKILERSNHLPSRLRDALASIEAPSDFAYRIALSPDLSARVFIAAAPQSRENLDITDRDQQTPLKLLVPILGPHGPEILRLTLYSLAIGELLAGQIVTLEIDAEIDRFELAPLALAVALADLLPSPAELALRIGCRDLFSIVVFPGGNPLPIPLFFKEISLVSRSLDGLLIESRWELPAPSLPHLAHAAATLKNLLLLPPDAAPASIPDGIHLTVGPNFVRLPDYLGGQILGSQDKGPVIDALPVVVRALAALQRLDWNGLLASIPDDLGVREVDIELGAAYRRARWLLSTAGPRDLPALSPRIRDGLAAIPTETGARVHARLLDVSTRGLRLAAAFADAGADRAIDIEIRFADLLGSIASLARLGVP
jgi:hypothetical protein